MVHNPEKYSKKGLKKLTYERNVMYSNINGVISGILELNDYLRDKNPDIVGLTETKLREGEDLMKVGEGKYNVWKRNRVGKMGGGVMLLVKKDIKVDQVKEGMGKAEVLKIRAETNEGKKRHYIVVYVPPKTNAWSVQEYEEMISDTGTCLEEMLGGCERTIMMGDFNCKEVCWEDWSMEGSETTWGNTLLTLAMENVLTQWVKEDTRFGGEGASSRLDLVFSTEPMVIEEMRVECPLAKSDHAVLEFKVIDEEKSRRNEEYKVGRWNYAKTDFGNLKKFFQETNWMKFKSAKGANEKWKEFIKIYKEGEKKFVPIRQHREVGKQDWFNDRCEKARTRKEDAWKRWRRKRRIKQWESYKRARNEYVLIRREERKKQEKDIIDKCKDQPRLFYRHVNNNIKNRESIESLEVNGVCSEDPREMAEAMNGCFRKVFTKETAFDKPLVMEQKGIMKEFQVTVEEIKNMMGSLEVRKAVGPDGVSGWILRECREQLAEKVCEVIDASLREGVVPQDWKRANIVPIYKSGNKRDPLNYRPVSLTSVVAKMCERVVKNRWTDFLEKNDILCECQFGFRKGRSCTTNLICYYSRVIDVIQERDGWADGIYLDLKKAFDKVPHRRLIWKLEMVGGVHGSLLKWMEDFLVGREMRTIIKDRPSEWGLVESGVPQGSVLAPVMFAVYINDMVDGVSSYVSLFADDAKLLRKVRCDKDCELLQEDLDRIWKWSCTWQMEFNTTKCKKIEFGKSERRIRSMYKIGNEDIKTSHEEKDLGVTITNDLSPERHINKIIGEVLNLLRNIRVAFVYLDEEMMKKIITAMIRPRLEYATIQWAPNLKKHIRKLEKVQRAATKMVPDLRDLTYEDRLKRMQLPTLENRRERGDLIAIYRVMIGMEKMDREDLCMWNERMSRGHGKKLKMATYRRDVKKYSFPHRRVEAWNSLDVEVVNARNIHDFKKKLDINRYGDGTTRA